MNADTQKRSEVRYARAEGTTWPIVGETGWQLRYAPSRVNLLHAASIAAAYAHLTDPSLSEREAIAVLRRARKAVSS